jgi:RND superfamily putative drug exporter
VLLDATIVRMIIVPAAMTLLGRAAWWLPRWLDRTIPNIDIEGEHLMATLETEAHETGAAITDDDDDDIVVDPADRDAERLPA